MGFSGGCRGSSGTTGPGRWEGAQQRQPPLSGPRPPGGLDPVLTLGRGSWVSVAGGILLLTGALLPLVQSRDTAGGSQGDPTELDGDQMPSMGKPNPASQSKAGPGPAPSGDL